MNFVRQRFGTVLMSVALVWVGAAVLLAQATSSSPQSAAPRTSAPAPAPQSAAPVRTQRPATATQARATVDETAKYQAWIKQYCISCHNSRTASPANEPVNLETAIEDQVKLLTFDGNKHSEEDLASSAA